jgi:transcriptional regulator with XRE-family HTH domain
MPARERVRTLGLVQADATRRSLGQEARNLRIGAGLTQSELSRAVGVSRGWLHRLETGRLRTLDLGRSTVLLAHLGHKLVVKAYPTGEPIRDAGHARLLDRFNARLSAAWQRTFESPMPQRGDLRAWDMLLAGSVRIGVEAETRLRDLQALERSISTKRRDSRVDRAILLVADTDANRALIARHVAILRSPFPLTTREILSALAAGRDPGADGIVVL